MILQIPISKESYTESVLKALGSFLDISNKEAEVMATMLDYNILILNSDGRERLRSRLKMDQANLNTYIYRLKKGRNLIGNKNNLSINPHIIKAVKDKSITFNFETY